jgi:hypothetical protein
MTKMLNAFEAMKLAFEGNEVRCTNYGANCGLILIYDGGFKFKGTIKVLRTDEIDYNAEWVVDMSVETKILSLIIEMGIDKSRPSYIWKELNELVLETVKRGITINEKLIQTLLKTVEMRYDN